MRWYSAVPCALPPAAVHGAGNFLAVTFGAAAGFQIFDVSNPASPQLKLTALQNPGGRPGQGVALWNQGNSYYVALRLSATISQPVCNTTLGSASMRSMR